ncbi:TPA: hypothetical protein U1268_001306 [Streptococcus suis]|nr:hypothetical protein [Streptococcus suis]HEM5121727.1 hypothetical protein [Streptococcus suis]HEM5156774.1 hypothetical protein [Streptococcus suis]HEM5192232.1 hypothetical protein [Streptococcus suis]
MRKIIPIGDQEYELTTNGYTPIAYKEEFGKDYFQDLFSMLNSQALLSELDKLEPGQELQASNIDMSVLADFDMTFFNRLFWTFAKSANPRIKPYAQFFMEMDEFPVQEIGQDLMEMLNASMATKKKQTRQNLQAMKSLQ